MPLRPGSDRDCWAADREQHLVQQLAGTPDERLTAPVLFGARGLTDNHPVRGRTAHAEHGLGAARMQRTTRTASDRRTEFVPVIIARIRLRLRFRALGPGIHLVPGDPEVDSHRTQVRAALLFRLNHVRESIGF